MADAPATRQALLSVFKEVYGQKIAEQPNRTAWIYNFFDNSTRRFGGKYWTAPMLDEGGQAVGSYNEDEEVADAVAEDTQEIQIRPRQHYALVQISGLAIAASKQSLHAFVQAKDFEIKNKTKWLISQLNVQYYGIGQGQLATVSASADGSPSTITVDLTEPFNMRWFRKGMKLDVFNAAITTKRNTAAKKSGYKITAVNKTTGVISLLDTGTDDPNSDGVVATDIICFEDSNQAAPDAPSDVAGKQILGLASLVDNNTEGLTTVQNIDRSVRPIFNSSVLSNGGTDRPLSLDLMQQLVDEIEAESGETPDFMVAGFGQRRNYLNLLWYDVRYGPQKLIGGFRTLQYNNLDWVVDKDCQLGRIYVGVRSELQKYVVAPIGILDQAGPQMERIPKKDVHELLIGGYMNLGMERPNTWGKMDDLDEP